MDLERFPTFLRTQQALADHLDAHFADRSNKERGDTFLDVAMKIIPLTEIGRRFSDIRASEKQSHDGGVDVVSGRSDLGETLYVQSKYRIRQKIEIDSIVSKFRSFERMNSPRPQGQLFSEEAIKKSIFMIVTSSDVSEIIKLYQESELSSRSTTTCS